MRVIDWPHLLGRMIPEPELTTGQIQVWQASIAVSPAILASLNRLLSVDEHARAERFRSPRDHDSYVVSRGLLRQLLAAYTGDQPGQIRLQYGPQGKPAMANPGHPQVRFNVSHSGGALLVGFAIDRELGIDVERLQADLDFAGLAQKSFSQTERASVVALTEEDRRRLFYEYWTCKEACIKADGRGLSVPLDQFTIAVSAAGSQWREIAMSSPGVLEPAMRVRILHSIPGYAAAVAAVGAEWDVVSMTLEDASARHE